MEESVEVREGGTDSAGKKGVKGGKGWANEKSLGVRESGDGERRDGFRREKEGINGGKGWAREEGFGVKDIVEVGKGGTDSVGIRLELRKGGGGLEKKTLV